MKVKFKNFIDKYLQDEIYDIHPLKALEYLKLGYIEVVDEMTKDEIIETFDNKATTVKAVEKKRKYRRRKKVDTNDK